MTYLEHPPYTLNQPASSPRTVVIGGFRVMYRPDQGFERARAKLLQQGLHVEETPHFLLARPSTGQAVTLVHHLAPEEVDNNIGQYLMQELAPHGLMGTDHAFGAALIGIVNSITPEDPKGAWDLFSLNTLQRLREGLAAPSEKPDGQNFITSFAAIYRRLFELRAGSSLLDVGCACAFWPLLIIEREHGTSSRIVGVDNRRDAIALSTNLAALVDISEVEFIQGDVLDPAFTELGTFDTVTAIHLLEHLPETQLPQALGNLLKATNNRLLIAVPYEQQAEIAYGHEQVFTREKLEAWGNWCIAQLHGRGTTRCEDVMGGLLIVER